LAPLPLAPVSPGGPPMDAREVRPCGWEGLGPGLCIFYPSRGGAPTKILEDAGLETIWPSSWSPDGQRIAFSAIKPGQDPGRDTTIYIVNADGSGLTELPSVGNDTSPAWSPDGEWLAFHSSGNLAIMRPDGSDPAVIWDSEGRACVYDPEWSPDSRWIAVSMQMGDCEWSFPMTREVWVISRDGVTVTTVATITHEDDSCVQSEVAFSPDGTQVAYFDAHCQPWIVNTDGFGQAVSLTDFPFWWISMVYPQWGGEKEALRPPPTPVPPPPTSALEAVPVPADPWGQVVVPPGDTIHIGLVADFSGAVGWLGPVEENAVQMAVEDQGPVKGFPVSAIVADGGCGEARGTAAAQTMISDPAIVGVIGHTCSVSCSAGAPVYEGAHLVMISPSCTGPDLSGPSYRVFNRVAIRDDQGGDERNRQVVNSDVYQDFARRYQDRYGQSLDSTEVDFFAAYAYDATVILIKAIELVAVVDETGNLVIGRQALANAMRATPGHPGVTGVISFDDRGDRLP